MGGRPCSICTHPQRAEIEAILIQKGTFKDVRGFGNINKNAPKRHFEEHMAIVDDPRVDEANEGVVIALVEHLEGVSRVPKMLAWGEEKLRKAAETAEKKGRTGEVISAVNGVTRLGSAWIEGAAKSEELRRGKVPLEEIPEYRAQVAKFLIALEPYPEARIAVAEVMNE